MTTGMDPRQTRSFRLRLILARLVVTFERLWPALWPSLAVVGVFVVLSLFGLWLSLPLALHLLLLLAFAGLLVWTLWRARRLLPLVSRDTGLARLETDSGTAHQPLRALDDTLPEGIVDPATRYLWELHRERLIRSLQRLRLAPPRSDLPRRDPWALRAALLLVLVVALVHARDDIGPRLVSAFTFAGRPAAATLPPAVDLWITPPAYTRRPPLVSEQTRGQASLTVPAGSEARVQAHHLPDTGDAPAELALGEARTALTALGPGSGEAKVTLAADSFLAVTDGAGREIARWFVDVVPDEPPTARFTREPRATHRSVLKIDLEALDDHGVAELALLLAPVGREGEVERLPLLKPGNQPPKVATGTYQDLTAHPLAGLPVRLQLEAADAIGQKGRSEPLEIVLPAREFRHPLARAVIEERRKLAGTPESTLDVAGRLAALAETRAAQEQPIAVPLSLRAAAARLALGEQDAKSRRSVIDLLWELALFIEDGALSVAERKLRDVQQELQQALEQGVEDAELERLMQELQQAMDEFLQELARQAMEQGQTPPQETMPLDESRMVDRRDLQEMLDRARELMRSGARDAARDMLAQLQEMLENLRAGQQQARRPSQGEQALSDLQKMIQLQQQLLERSFEMNRQQGQGRDQQQQGGQRQPGQQGQQQGRNQGGQQDQMGQSAAEQEALRRALGELMRRMGEAGMEIPRALGQAEMQMRGARDALGQGEPGAAAEAQTQAVDAMQRAGQAMMEQLQEQMAQQQGEGPGGQPQPTARRGRDPLGRSTRNDGGMDTRDVQVPDESELGRARDVLEELYRRSGDRRRAPLELDYYRRLLDRF
jgi:uncharacterized protein (TIGR02302 family)